MTTPLNAHPVPARRRRFSTLVWGIALLALVLWSLTAWATALLFTGGGDFLVSQAAIWSAYWPELELAVATATAWIAQFGPTTLWIVWAFGAVSIVFGAWIVDRCVRALQGAFDGARPQAAAAWNGARDRLEARRDADRPGLQDGASGTGRG